MKHQHDSPGLTLPADAQFPLGKAAPCPRGNMLECWVDMAPSEGLALAQEPSTITGKEGKWVDNSELFL